MQAQQSGQIQQDTQNEQVQSNNFQNQEEGTVIQPLYIFSIFSDSQGNPAWGPMLPDYYAYFCSNLQIIADLKQTTNKKWTKQQTNQYLRFLNDLQSYILNYVWTGQVTDFNHFTQAMITYGQTQNKIGYQLYDIQLDYLQKVSSGYDFKLDKKNKKNNPNQPQQQPKEVIKKIIQPKEQVIIRKGDPQINIQALMNTQWSQQKYGNIQIFKKQSANLVFIGHVDSGKSTLTGNILKELGEVDQQQWARNKQQAKQNGMQAWQLAGIADVDPSERKRGKTIECAKLMFSLQNRRFTLFDAPGHKNYVPNMIMGACQADIAVLIISAKEGQFQSGFQKQGQTKQHAMLAKSLGVSGFLVAVTKMNTVDWSQKRYQLIKDQVTPFLQNSCGFSDVPFIPIDSINNINIHKKVQSTWYKGPALLEYLNTVHIPQRKPLGPLRIPLIDKFKQVGNLYVYGKIESGSIIEDQTVTILPSRRQMVIKQIINAKDQRLPFAMAGQNVKLKVKGIEQNQIKRGDIVCNNLNYCQESYEFKAVLNILQIPQNKKLMSSGYECVLHMHAITQQVQILKVEAKVDKTTKKNVVATFLKPGEQGTVIIKVSNMICLQKYDFMPSLGRFTLRDEGKTIGYGIVTKIKPAKSLLDEQKDHLGVKKQETKTVEKAMEQMTINQ